MDRFVLGPDGRPRTDGISAWRRIQDMQLAFALRAGFVPDVLSICSMIREADRDVARSFFRGEAGR